MTRLLQDETQTYDKGLTDRKAIEDVLNAWYAAQRSAMSPMPQHIRGLIKALGDLPTDEQVRDQDDLFGVKHPEGER